MWIASENGFLSVFQHRERPDQGLVRTRVRKVLEAIFPDDKMVETPDGDFRFSMFASKQAAAEINFQHAWEIDYPNFKSDASQSSSQKIKVYAYHDSWALMWNNAKLIARS